MTERMAIEWRSSIYRMVRAAKTIRERYWEFPPQLKGVPSSESTRDLATKKGSLSGLKSSKAVFRD